MEGRLNEMWYDHGSRLLDYLMKYFSFFIKKIKIKFWKVTLQSSNLKIIIVNINFLYANIG